MTDIIVSFFLNHGTITLTLTPTLTLNPYEKIPIDVTPTDVATTSLGGEMVKKKKNNVHHCKEWVLSFARFTGISCGRWGKTKLKLVTPPRVFVHLLRQSHSQSSASCHSKIHEEFFSGGGAILHATSHGYL